MSPEAIAPRNLIFVDTWLQDGRLLGRGQRITSPGLMTVSWYAIEAPAGSHALGSGVAYIYEANKLRVSEIPAVQVPRANGRYYWRDKALGGGLMFVMLLPEGQTLADPEPQPREAKTHDGRIAVYWKLEGLGRDEAVVRWQLAPLVEDVDTAAESLNDRLQDAADSPYEAGVAVADDREVQILLRDLLLEGFSEAELDDLAFELGLEPDDLAGPDRRAKARGLVTYLARRGRLPDLAAAGRRLRPNLDWPIL